MSNTKNLREFHEKIGAPIANKPTIPLVDWRFNRFLSILQNAAGSIILEHEGLRTGSAPKDTELLILRCRLMIEELYEFAQAASDRNLIQMADSLADLEYVVRGTGITYGIDLDAVHEIVHRSNMSKTGMDQHSKGGKGEGYVSPEKAIGEYLTSQGTPEHS
jgi:hypothetical protein